MRVLLLGYSSIARRRVIPALRRLGIQELDIASISSSAIPGHQGRWFRDYAQALSQSDADVVYVSTTNDLHARLAVQALRRGVHVIVDKPAGTSLTEVREVADAAQSAGRCVAEATVYGYHPQVVKSVELFQGRATRILAAFSIPPLAASNYRYRADLGGGADLDMGPYAVSPARLFFGSLSLHMDAHVLSDEHGVITGFSVLSRYSKGRCLAGVFGFTTGYTNQLQILGADLNICIERTFSPPPDSDLPLRIRENDRDESLVIPQADSFREFLHDVFLAIANGEYQSFRERLLLDAVELEALRTALAKSRQPAA